MTCPKCDEGRIKKILFKKTKKEAYMCDFCESLWFAGEDIRFNTGHPPRSHAQGEDMEYTVEESEEKDQEHRPL